ncbi:MAG: zinc ribbon domain-containing protein [Ktedonobacteraceae bacterium]
MSSPRFCSECGKPLETGHRFCTDCGATTSGEADARTALTSDQTVSSNEHAQGLQSQVQAPQVNSNATASTIITPNANAPRVANTPVLPNVPVSSPEAPGFPGTGYSTVPASSNEFYAQATDADVIPPPPPPDSFISAPREAPATPYYSPSQQPNGAVPAYAQAPKRSRGCLITSIVLLLVLALGGLGGFYIIGHNISSGSSQNGNTSSGQQNTPSGSTPTIAATSGSNGNTPGQGGPTAVPLNLKFTYSSVDITLVSVLQASSFSDDTSTPQGGVRVSMTEVNSTTNNASFLYSDVVRLVMPDGSVNAPSNEKNSVGPDAGISRDNWIDFVVTAHNIDLSKLVLRFGSPTENLINIPLVAGAGLSKYQSKVVTPNSTFQYAGLNWTLTSATESLSANGKQATTGMIYVTVNLKAVNTSANNFSAYPGDYMRIQSGDSKSPPSDFTFPTSVASQSNGTGTVTFAIPQGGTSFTLLMLTQQSSPPINSASVTFQIQ